MHFYTTETPSCHTKAREAFNKSLQLITTYICGAVVKQAGRALKRLEHSFSSRGQHLEAAREKRQTAGLARSALRWAGVRVGKTLMLNMPSAHVAHVPPTVRDRC